MENVSKADLTYRDRLLIHGWKEEEIKGWTEEKCENEYDAALSALR